jgi:lipoprotein-anchoring transpeptidase ErfK/SrfK
MLSAKTDELIPPQHTQERNGGSAFATLWGMKVFVTILSILIGTAGLAQTPAGRSGAARPTPKGTAGVSLSDTLAIQVMLDRAGFSPGEIDGRPGSNSARAVTAFQRAMGLAESGQPDPETQQRLAEATGNAPALVEYEIREADIAGPFTPVIPADLVEQSKLPSLGYQNALEAIAERFHASPQLLKRLNGTATFSRAGERIQIPNVEPFELPQRVAAPAQRGRGRATRGASRGAPAPPAFTIAVTKSTSALTVEDASGRVVFHAPVTTGSEHDPLPIGTWKVTTVQVMPKFNYNPDLFWDANATHSKATIPSGPNNPVGVAWIDLSKEHYGIHGSPEPSRIGHVQSHGCVRLTNWDVQRVLMWAQPGTPVVFRE